MPAIANGRGEALRRVYNNLVDRLARVTTSGRRIRELDGLRFIAIAVVVIQHVYQVVLAHYPAGQVPPHDLAAALIRDWRIGVELFFVISGFILATPFAAQHLLGAKPVQLRQYYWRRITRLEPPYLLSMFIWFGVIVWFGHQSARAYLPHLLASCCYVHNLFYKDFNNINPVTWSLEIEVQFYVLAPFLAAVFLIQTKWLRRWLIVAAMIAVEQLDKFAVHYFPNRPMTLIDYLPLFLAGFLLADVFLVDWKEKPRASFWGDLLAIPGWLLLPFYFQQEQLLGHVIVRPTFFPFILLGLCWASFRSRWMRGFLASSFVMTVGGMCYSIYLLHLPLIRMLGWYSPIPLLKNANLGINSLLYSLVWGVPVLAASIVYFILIEKPCMRKDWPIKLWHALRGHPDASQGRPIEVQLNSAAEKILDLPTDATSPLPPNQPVP